VFDFGDPNSLLLSLLVSFIGLGLWMYGKKQQRLPQMVAGVVYMAYPYFVSKALTMLLIGVGVGVGLWLALRQGY
jgi:hypothetical protein